DRTLKRINLAIKSLIYACLTGFTLLSGTVLLVGSYPNWAIVAFCGSAFWFLFLLRSLMKLSIREKLDRLAQK
ncbi:MAG: AarF/ABC1/UbiB kinase family protein, partial [Cyanobacteriota bacterium]